MTQSVIESAQSSHLTSTGDVTTRNAALMGFYVNSSSGGELALRTGGASGELLGGAITPDAGYHAYPCACPGGLHATISGTLDVTFFFAEVA